MVQILGWFKFMIKIGAKAQACKVDPELLIQLPPRPEMLPEWNISKEVSHIHHAARV